MNRLRSRHSWQLRDEMRGAHDLHVELQLLLESGQGPVERVLLGNEQDVGVDRALAPAEQDGGRPRR